MRTIQSPGWQHCTVVHDPPFGQDDEAFDRCVGALDDRDGYSARLVGGPLRLVALIAAIDKGHCHPWALTMNRAEHGRECVPSVPMTMRQTPPWSLPLRAEVTSSHGHAAHPLRKDSCRWLRNRGRPAPSAASPELSDRPRRRTFTSAYKLGILRQVDEAGPGGIGAILRREGLYSSLLTDWRRQRDAGACEALKAVKRGPKVAEPNPLAAEHAQLQRDYKSVTLRLQRAEAIVEIQKKVALLLGLSMPGDEAS